uniref:Fanconi anemia core complex-associated protein 100-like n=1 Tax=Sinocyclocheilus rhinocerous TaxID=307959 RepID=A0A673HZC0_9TELE
MDAVRCSVEYLSEFSDCQSHSVRVIQDGVNLFLTRGDRDVLIFNIQERRVTTVMLFEASVINLALSDDKHRLYALCANGGLYCTPLPPQLSSSVRVNKSPDSVQYTVPDDSIVLKNASLQAFTIVEKILVTLSLHKSVWSFDLYEEPGSRPLHKLACFQVVTLNTCCLNLTDKEKSVSSPPVLTCIYPEGSTSVSTDQSDLRPHLEPHLFRLLFGVDASLVNSPVILCGLPDGRICCFPLLVPTLAGPTGEQRSPVRVLQSLEQPVVFIGTCISGEHGPQCLVAVGQRGKLLIVRSKQASMEGKKADYSFNEHSVRGPVLCACVDDKRLYYSSLNDLHALQLTTTSSSEATGTESQLQALTSDSLGVCRAIALAGPYTNPTGSVQLLAVSLSGRLLRVNLPQGSENVPRLPSSLAGQRVKDLLASIANIWERAESLKHKLQEKNESLKHLNQVINVCSLMLDNHGNEKVCNMGTKRPISCCGVARWSSLLQRDSLTLTCVLENSSGCTLEHGWTLCIQVHPLSKGPNMEGSSGTYSFPFMKLDSGQKLDVTIPLESTGGLSLPVKVYCSLVFSLSALFSPEASSPGVSQLLTEMGSISAPLSTLTVDWLDALRLDGSFSNGNIRHNTVTDGIQTFLRSRGAITRDSDTTTKSGPITVMVRVSSQLLNTKLHLSATSSTERCMSVLNWLVSPEERGQMSVQSPVVCAYSPDGCSVKLLVKEVTLGDFCSDGPLEVLEIRVESSSVAAVCGLHHAILRRLQVLLRDAAVKCVHTKQLKAQSLIEAVRLYEDLQDAQNQEALGGTMKTNKNSEILFRIFLQLRANPLVIL